MADITQQLPLQQVKPPPLIHATFTPNQVFLQLLPSGSARFSAELHLTTSSSSCSHSNHLYLQSLDLPLSRSFGAPVCRNLLQHPWQVVMFPHNKVIR